MIALIDAMLIYFDLSSALRTYYHAGGNISNRSVRQCDTSHICEEQAICVRNGMNIGGGKTYNRNEFPAAYGHQSVNTSRPPSIHVDDFPNSK